MVFCVRRRGKGGGSKQKLFERAASLGVRAGRVPLRRRWVAAHALLHGRVRLLLLLRGVCANKGNEGWEGVGG